MKVLITQTGATFVAPGRVRHFTAGRTEDVTDDVAARLIADRTAVPAEEPPADADQAGADARRRRPGATVPSATPAK